MRAALDGWTEFLRAALRFLLLHSPLRTSLGASGGVFAGVVLDIFRPYLHAVDLTYITDFRLAIAGIFISNAAVLFKKNRLPESIEQQFTVAARAIKEGKIAPTQARMLYIQIVANAIQHAKLTVEAEMEVDDLSKPSDKPKGRARPPTPASR